MAPNAQFHPLPPSLRIPALSRAVMGGRQHRPIYMHTHTHTHTHGRDTADTTT